MRHAAVLLSLTLVAAPVMSAPSDGLETLFEAKVRPVLTERCFKCHGGDKTSAGLRVDSREALLKGGERGPAIVPGDAGKSLLVRALRHQDDTLKMPPNGKLPDAVIADVAAWINQGAAWPAKASVRVSFAAPNHWAFQPVRAAAPPADPTGWAENALDHFIAARLRAEGLKPAEQADRLALLRRVTFDLTGLPPTLEELKAFNADTSPDAYARVVERLLASPRYGERWGRYWMDVVRYADTAGDNADYPVPEARLYRDCIIDSFNADKPYDQFLREQLAGDLLAKTGPHEKYAEQVVATTFLGLSRRYLTAPYEQWHLTLEDTIDTVGRGFLGLTLRCARCHDHKFDPVTRDDYYALYGIFASTEFPFAGSEEFASMKKPRQHFVPLLPPAEAAPKLEAHRKKVQELKTALEEAKKGDPKKAKSVEDELWALEKAGLPADLPAAYGVSDGKPVDVAIQISGDPDKPGAVVKRGVPKFLAGKEPFAIKNGGSGRLELANWIASKDNPLTARVLVNRIWQHHFGAGLVGTPSNFGLRGEPPTHPELLDWLASEFMRNGWSIKAIHRLIVLSKTYRLASTHSAENALKDPGNRWHWRFDRRRLDAEALRDAMLAVSGRLDLRRPGPHPFPPIVKWGWTQHNAFKDIYASDNRSVYLMTQRLKRHPFLALFDGPDTNVTTDTRTSSTVPLQALFLMNNRWAHEQAEGLARRVMTATKDEGDRVRLAYELAYGRRPKGEEVDSAGRYLAQYRAELARANSKAETYEAEAWGSLARVLMLANEFVYIE